MKKLMYGICMLGLVAMISTSCKKNDEQQGTTFTVSTTAFVDEDMKAYYNPAGNYFMFEAGDAVKVYNIDDENPSNSVAQVFHVAATGQGTQTISGPSVGAMKSAYYAFYPAGMAEQNMLKNENRDHFEFSNQQNAFMIDENSITMGGDAVPMCAKSTEDLHFQFYNIFGICNIRLWGTAQQVVSAIELTDNEYHLSGWAEFKVNKVDQERIEGLMDLFTNSDDAFATEYANYLNGYDYSLGYIARGTSMTMRYDCSNLPGGGVQLSQSRMGEFRIGLRPMALSEGFTYKIYFTDGSACKVTKYKDPNRAYGMVPNRIKNFTIDLQTENPDNLEWE